MMLQYNLESTYVCVKNIQILPINAVHYCVELEHNWLCILEQNLL
jgi:hypothetical protein